MLALLLTLLAGEFVFDRAPFPACHASTLVELRDGGRLAAWFGGSAEGRPDVAIWASRLSGGHWSEPAELAREPGVAAYNPVLFYTQDRRLWLYYKFGPSPSTWTAARRFSLDDGKTWSAVEHLPAGLYGPIRAKPLVLPGGVVVSGTSVESYHAWAAWIERSTDHGRTFTRIGPIALPLDAPPDQTHGLIQPSVVALSARHLRLFARSTRTIGKICVADSFDAGLTWSAAHAIDLPNPNSGIDAVALRDGRVVLVYNHSASQRTPLNLAVSRDGEHFQPFLTLEDAPGEYSYPALIQSSSGALEVTYTWNRQKIKYARIALRDVPAVR